MAEELGAAAQGTAAPRSGIAPAAPDEPLEPIWPAVVGILCVLLGAKAVLQSLVVGILSVWPGAEAVPQSLFAYSIFWTTSTGPWQLTVYAWLGGIYAVACGGIVAGGVVMLRSRRWSIPSLICMSAALVLVVCGWPAVVLSLAGTATSATPPPWVLGVVLLVLWAALASLPPLGLLVFLVRPSAQRALQPSWQFRHRLRRLKMQRPWTIRGAVSLLLAVEALLSLLSLLVAWVSGIVLFARGGGTLSVSSLGGVTVGAVVLSLLLCQPPLLVSPFLAVGGIGLLRQRRWGAWVHIVLAAILCAAGGVLFVVWAAEAMHMDQGRAAFESDRDAAFVLFVLLGNFLAASVWPLAVTIWSR